MGPPVEYYAQARLEMLQFVPDSTSTLIDIGCGEGRFGEAVKRKLPNCEVWGVESVASVASIAAQRNDKIIRQKIQDTIDLPDDYFDIVTMNDVLEHLIQSDPILTTVKKIIGPSGFLILSLQNVRYYLTVRDLIFRGDWQYQDFGILDRTHLRFFTQISAARLLTANGFEVTTVMGLNAPSLKLHYRALFAVLPRSFSDMVFPQFALLSRPIK